MNQDFYFINGEDLQRVIKLCLKNVTNLLDDVEILCNNHGNESTASALYTMAIEEFGKLIVLKKCYEMVPTTENTHSVPKSIFGKGKGHREKKYNASLQYCQFDVLAGAFLRYKIASSPLVVASLPLNIIVVNVLGSFVLFQIKSETEREPTNCQCMSTGVITHSKCRYCKQVWCPQTLKQDWCPNADCSQGIKGSKFKPYDERQEWVKCSICEMWFRTPDILAVHNCYIKGVQAIVEAENDNEQPQSLPLPTATNQNPPYRIVSSNEQEPVEQESEVDRYWRTHKLKPKPKDNRIHYTIQ